MWGMTSNPTPALEFAHAARLLAGAARRLGLMAPSYRCPPKVVGVQRTVRRHSQGAVVAVQVKDRPWLAVLGDMIEGVVVANRLTPPQADRVRDQLWEAVGVEPAARVA